MVVCHANKDQNWEVEGKMRAHVAGQSVESRLDFHNPGEARLGMVQIDTSGTHTLTLEVTSDFNNAPRYRSVMLVPVTQDK